MDLKIDLKPSIETDYIDSSRNLVVLIKIPYSDEFL